MNVFSNCILFVETRLFVISTGQPHEKRGLVSSTHEYLCPSTNVSVSSAECNLHHGKIGSKFFLHTKNTTLFVESQIILSSTSKKLYALHFCISQLQYLPPKKLGFCLSRKSTRPEAQNLDQNDESLTNTMFVLSLTVVV